MHKKTLVHSGGLGFSQPLSVFSAESTIQLAYLRISHETLREYRKRREFSGVVRAIDESIKNQKFDGAAAGFFNANIIARDLGLKDKSEVLNRNINADISDPVEEMKKRGIPIPNIELEDIDEE